MKKPTTIALVISSLLIGCSETPQEADIKVQANGKPLHSIRITVEGEKDIVIEDPYIDEIQTLSEEFKARRSHFMKEYKNMSSEEREAYGDFRDNSGERMRDLQAKRKRFIIEKMKEFGGTDFKLEGGNPSNSVDSTKKYFEELK